MKAWAIKRDGELTASIMRTRRLAQGTLPTLLSFYPHSKWSVARVEIREVSTKRRKARKW